MGKATESNLTDRIIDRLSLKEESTSLKPSTVAAILEKANRGWNHRQSKLAEEILEKDPEIAAAVSIRQQAITGTDWTILPASGENKPNNISKWVEKTLRAIPGNIETGFLSFPQYLSNLATSYMPGFQVSQIMWEPGGDMICGFYALPAHNFTFWESPFLPKLRTKQHREDGIPLPGGAKSYAIHRHFTDGRDIPRTGLIRPLAWIYSFKNLNTKDLLRFREKFGIPFIWATMADIINTNGAYTADARNAKNAIQNFGSDGGGLFSENVELNMIEPKNIDGGIFFDSFRMFTNQISKTVLGQTSSQDSENSNRSTAQVHDGVRHDILVADCKSISFTVDEQIIRPLVINKFGPDAEIPHIKFNCELPPDRKANAEVFKTMKDAGFVPGNVSVLNELVGNADWQEKAEPEPVPMESPEGDEGDEAPVEVTYNGYN